MVGIPGQETLLDTFEKNQADQISTEDPRIIEPNCIKQNGTQISNDESHLGAPEGEKLEVSIQNQSHVSSQISATEATSTVECSSELKEAPCCSVAIPMQRENGTPARCSKSFLCPVTGCENDISATSLLSHCLSTHDSKIHELVNGQHAQLSFNYLSFEIDRTVCIGVLAFKGESGDNRTPAGKGLCVYNEQLGMENIKLQPYLPIMVLACKSKWVRGAYGIFQPGEKNAADTEADFSLVVWLASVATPKPLHFIVIAHDRFKSECRTGCFHGRRLGLDKQNPDEFLENQRQFLGVTLKDLKILSMYDRDDIHLSIIIEENLK